VVGEAEFDHIEVCGVKRITVPLAHVLMLRVIGVRHGGDELLVAWSAAHIFRWCGIGAGQAQGAVGQFRVAEQLFLDLDPVFPVVAKVIDVFEGA
jgi:hypothetical protein